MEYLSGSNGPEGSPSEELDLEYGEEQSEDYHHHQNETKMINSVVGDGTHKDREIGLSALAFDQHEELLWAGTRSGHVTSYYGMQLQKYTSFQVHPRDHVRCISSTEQSILILTNTTLRGQHRRGIPQFNFTNKNMVDMHSLIYNNRNQRVLMSGMQEHLIEYDITSGKQVSVINTEGSCALLRNHPRFVCCGDVPRGKIQLRDHRTLKMAHSLDAHSGTLSDFDVHGHHLITCGQSVRHGIEQPDRFLMVYDMRILRAISPIQSMFVPYQLKFLPSMTSQIAIMSANGQVQMADTACLSTPNIAFFQVEFNCEGLNTISMDISPSNQVLAFGDTGNTLYLYSSYDDPVLNPYSRATEFADPVEPLPPMAIEDEFGVYASVPRPHLPPGVNSYLSDLWPDKFSRVTHRVTPDINPEILRSMKIIGTVGYARNVTNMKRNLVAYPNVKKPGHAGDPLIPSSSLSSPFNAGREKKMSDCEGRSMIPKRYRKVVVKYSKLGVEDFDFDRYNRTGFCGLEATLPNAYSNAMLQILYFIEDFHKMILNHVCSRETCLACELSFLFHMMNHSSGAPCQSSNFLRSLRTIPEASALGIVLSDENGIKKCNVPRLIQSWNRFILQQTHNQCTQMLIKEEEESGSSSPTRSKSDSGSSIVSDLFGFKQDKISLCTRCKSSVSSTDLLQVVNLVYPELPPSSSEESLSPIRFQDIVCSSLCPEQTTPAWCDKCRKYQPTTITRLGRSLPKILNLNAGCDNSQDVNFWRLQSELAYKEAKRSAPEEQINGNTTTTSESPEECHITNNNSINSKTSSEGLKLCRYGNSCNRVPDCKFWHPKSDDESKPADFGDRLFNENISWVPASFTLRRHEDGSISSKEEKEESKDSSPILESITYDLYAVCVDIVDGKEHLNLVACINIGPYFHSKIASPVSQWYILNDFSISTISEAEAVWFNLSWKIPCILVYQSRPLTEKKPAPIINPITSDVFNEGRSLATRRESQKRLTFIPLGADEIPQPGDLTAIDAEFVTLNQEESELRSDGKVSLLKAAHVSVARITVVRGNGPLEGTPFIDDYISTQEQVVDYVTKFSGIKPGDLDANSSSKHLTTLKAAYLKLRYLVDTGAVFVGHGLKNDFRVINIVVPPEQIVDTVHLFHLPHNRMVSLKFLAWFFLKIKIQGETHDSIEDAVTALKLYKRYLKLKEEHNFITALNALYEKGKELNWKIPEEELL
eukprot:TRINITY_DN6183_c0_g1_i1.p1 TRINITY_DN6183_c0_g1~~TRINITY_DN6183_c0_g1_i1.p1  ORF type:complete len:1219 (-),score=351.45 TRINITY_DN6183_c0_g1_i1:406-4062(-)